MPAADPSPFLHTEVHYLHSDHVGGQFKLLVGRCGISEDSADPVVLYLADADFAFGGAMNTIWGLQMLEYLPPMLVVGIGYPVEDEAATFPLRVRDLTPSVDAWHAEKSGWKDGGAETFLRFVAEELKPWVSTTFGVESENAAYAGHSLGGLFGAYVLLTEAATFTRYVLGSPSLWYDHWSIFEREAAYASSHADLAAKVFVCAGELETPEGDLIHRAWLPADKRAVCEADAEEEAAAGYGEASMVEDVERFVAALGSRGYPSLEIGSAILAGENHATAALPALSRGLRFLFDAPV